MTADEFRAKLQQLGLSQSEAARRMNVPRLKVWRWCNGIHRIDGEIEALLECWKTVGSKREKRRGKRKCLFCGIEGHTSVTCPSR